jgi:hypothetical protein
MNSIRNGLGMREKDRRRGSEPTALGADHITPLADSGSSTVRQRARPLSRPRTARWVTPEPQGSQGGLPSLASHRINISGIASGSFTINVGGGCSRALTNEMTR